MRRSGSRSTARAVISDDTIIIQNMCFADESHQKVKKNRGELQKVRRGCVVEKGPKEGVEIVADLGDLLLVEDSLENFVVFYKVMLELRFEQNLLHWHLPLNETKRISGEIVQEGKRSEQREVVARAKIRKRQN